MGRPRRGDGGPGRPVQPDRHTGPHPEPDAGTGRHREPDSGADSYHDRDDSRGDRDDPPRDRAFDQRSSRAAATATAAPAGLRPEFYYALFRAGLAADQDSLFRTGSGTVQAIWNQAIAQHVIPQSLAAQVPTAVQGFQALSAAHLLTAPPPVGLSTMQQMLAPTLTAAADQQKFSGLFTQYRDNWSQFWPAVEKELGAGPAKQLQFTGQLSFLTINNAPLVAALNKAEAQKPLAATVDLANRGYYDPAKWTPLIGTSIPPGVPGSSVDEQRTNYAQLLAAQVRISHPTAVLADQVGRGIVPIADTQDVATAVSGFLSTHQADFAIGVEPVERYIALEQDQRHVDRGRRAHQAAAARLPAHAGQRQPGRPAPAQPRFGVCHHALRFGRIRPRLPGAARRCRQGRRGPRPRQAGLRGGPQYRHVLRQCPDRPGARRPQDTDPLALPAAPAGPG